MLDRARRTREATRLKARARDRLAYGHSWGFLHAVPAAPVLARQVEGAITRYQAERAAQPLHAPLKGS